MSKLRKIVWAVIAFEVAIAGLHLWLNVGFDTVLRAVGLRGDVDRRAETLRVGFLPVT